MWVSLGVVHSAVLMITIARTKTQISKGTSISETPRQPRQLYSFGRIVLAISWSLCFGGAYVREARTY